MLSRESFPTGSLHDRVRDRSPAARRSEGIVLATVLILIFVLITAVYAFQRRAVIDTMIAQNRIDSARADTLARGGVRFAEVLVVLIRSYKELQGAAGSSALPGLPPPAQFEALWSKQLAETALLPDGEDHSLRIRIEDESARLNLNALEPPTTAPSSDSDDAAAPSSDAVQYLAEVLKIIVDNMERPADGNKNYDEQEIAENLLDWMDKDDSRRGSGGAEDDYYRGEDPPYRAADLPFLSFDEIGLVEGVDPPLLEAMRDYLTVYPVAGKNGVNLNQAEPWVLSIVYSGPSGDKELLRPRMIEDLVKLRRKNKIVCTDSSADAEACVGLNDIGNGSLATGSFYPEIELPATPEAFRVTVTARAGNATRRIQAIYDARPGLEPILLSWRRLRGPE